MKQIKSISLIMKKISTQTLYVSLAVCVAFAIVGLSFVVIMDTQTAEAQSYCGKNGYVGPHARSCGWNEYCTDNQCVRFPNNQTAPSAANGLTLYCSGGNYGWPNNPYGHPNQHLLNGSSGPAGKCERMGTSINEYHTNCNYYTNKGQDYLRDFAVNAYNLRLIGGRYYRSFSHYKVMEVDSPICNSPCFINGVTQWGECTNNGTGYTQTATRTRRVRVNGMFSADPACVSEPVVRTCVPPTPDADDPGITNGGGDPGTPPAGGDPAGEPDFSTLSCMVTYPQSEPYYINQEITINAHPHSLDAVYTWGGTFVDNGIGNMSTASQIVRSFNSSDTYYATVSAVYNGIGYQATERCTTEISGQNIIITPSLPDFTFEINPNIANDAGYCVATWTISDDGDEAVCTIITEFDEPIGEPITNSGDGNRDVIPGNEYRMRCVAAADNNVAETSDSYICIDPNLLEI